MTLIPFMPDGKLNKKQHEELIKKIKDMGIDGCIKSMIEKGWCSESAKMICETIFKLIGE